MGLNLETLVMILGVLTLAILADGVRRMIRDRHVQTKLKGLGKHDTSFNISDEELDNPELPSGGARVVSRTFNKVKVAEPLAEQREPEIVAQTPKIAQAPETEEPEELPQAGVVETAVETVHETSQEAATPQESVEPEAQPEPQPVAALVPEPEVQAPVSQPAKVEVASKPRAPKVKLPEGVAPEVLVARVVPPKGYNFAGPGLLALIKSHGLEFGDMNIFHAYGEEADANVQQFSMANAIEPGTFDIETFDDTEFYGFTFFLMMPGPSRPLVALNRMLEVVTSLAKALGADLEDEQRSVLTPQTMEHLRERVREFERRSRLK